MGGVCIRHLAQSRMQAYKGMVKRRQAKSQFDFQDWQHFAIGQTPLLINQNQKTLTFRCGIRTELRQVLLIKIR